MAERDEPEWERRWNGAGGLLRFAVGEGIASLWFDNPDKVNALSAAMMAGTIEFLHAVADDDTVRVVILTGAGERAFAAGADITQLDTNGDDGGERFSGSVWERFQETIGTFPKPTLAAIRGYCLGGGLAAAICTDIRIASTDASFAIPAARLGVGYGYDGVARLVSLVGPARARYILYTAARFDAAAALGYGLVERVVGPDRLEAEAYATARTIAANAPLTVRAAKAAIDALERDPADRDLAAVERHIGAARASADFVEGRAAFIEKRQPRFTGR